MKEERRLPNGVVEVTKYKKDGSKKVTYIRPKKKK